ncbi:ISL3 family transposase [Puniceicoccus vermicola]|uniref:ISL3 family transposase n=4 Tax=Puniceicoccus vermicola TaxID=388746 RepID=A0A7X1B155_9BACT|nr:ISL3 family transposase [Puniceicoccus vermicola]
MINREIGIKGYRMIGVESISSQRSEVHVSPKEAPERCPCCGGDRLHSKGRYKRRASHLDLMSSRCDLVVHTRRWQCLDCRRSFVPAPPGIRPWRRSTEKLRHKLYRDHEDGIDLKTLSSRSPLSAATAGRIFRQWTERLANERSDLHCPSILGIDEHTLHRKSRFVTTFCDLRNNRVFDLAEGKSEEELAPFLRSLKGRERVQVVCIDLSSSYRKLVRRWFPKARIVADRFHVVRVLGLHFNNLCRSIAPEITAHSGLLAAIRTKPQKLSQKQLLRLQELFRKYPALEPLYLKKWQIHSLLCRKRCSAPKCRTNARELNEHIQQLQKQGFPDMATLAKTLTRWIEPIARTWRYTKNNAITEGFHRKMKLIQRRAYGFRSFQNYRLRVLATCT